MTLEKRQTHHDIDLFKNSESFLMNSNRIKTINKLKFISRIMELMWHKIFKFDLVEIIIEINHR